VDKLYGIKCSSAPQDSKQSEPVSIEESIEDELSALKPVANPADKPVLRPIRPNVECLVYMEVQPPIQPVELVHQICLDAAECSDVTKRKSKYLNRLTPVSLMGRAYENEIDELATKVLSPWFRMRANGNVPSSSSTAASSEEAEITRSVPSICSVSAEVLLPRHRFRS